MSRISNAQLGEIALRLSARDREILHLFRKLTFLKTEHIRRLFFYTETRPVIARGNTTTGLYRLEANGLLTRFPKQSGGYGGGSKSIVWFLTEPGSRLLQLEAGEEGKRKRIVEPSQYFLKHTLARAETYVQIMEICRMGNLVAKRIDTEPDCWRSYTKDGKDVVLRPDLYSESQSGQYADYFFFEIDLGTESMTRIVEKVRRYQQYYATRKEQEQHGGIFPAVIWLVQTEARKELIEQMIRSRFSGYPKINQVITPNRLWTLLNDGFSKDELC